ncbi:Uma2 family endonuclease [Breznakiellaceae bacterium SP9]
MSEAYEIIDDEEEPVNAYQFLIEPRYERIDDILYAMGSPQYWHQRIVFEMAFQLRSQLEPYGCEVFIAPFDAYILADLGNDETFVEPDLFISCDQNKIEQLRARKQAHYHGAPAIIIEVLSPSTRSYDLNTKRELYRRAGVREYWVVDPDEKILYTAHINLDVYKTTDLVTHPIAALGEIPGCTVDFGAIF